MKMTTEELLENVADLRLRQDFDVLLNESIDKALDSKIGDQFRSADRSFTNSELCDRFLHHSPSEEGAWRHRVLSELFIGLARNIDSICPPGREKSLVLTKLEEAKMWASAAVARNIETR